MCALGAPRDAGMRCADIVVAPFQSCSLPLSVMQTSTGVTKTGESRSVHSYFGSFAGLPLLSEDGWDPRIAVSVCAPSVLSGVFW